MKYGLLLLAVSLLGLSSCSTPVQQGPKKYYFDVYSDPAFAPFVQSAIETEQVQDTNFIASLEIKVQEEAIDSLLEGKVPLIFVGRSLTTDEEQYLKANHRALRSHEIAWDALAVIRHKDDPDTVITVAELSALAKDPKSKVLVDRGNSANLAFLLQRLHIPDKEANIYGAGSDSMVIETIKANKGVTGIISYAYMADKDDPEMQKRLADVRLIAISDSAKKAVLPSLDALASDLYPLKRKVYMLSSEGVNGVSAGISAFMLQDRGNRLLLKMGILPIKMPGREVELVNKGL